MTDMMTAPRDGFAETTVAITFPPPEGREYTVDEAVIGAPPAIRVCEPTMATTLLAEDAMVKSTPPEDTAGPPG